MLKVNNRNVKTIIHNPYYEKIVATPNKQTVKTAAGIPQQIATSALTEKLIFGSPEIINSLDHNQVNNLLQETEKDVHNLMKAIQKIGGEAIFLPKSKIGCYLESVGVKDRNISWENKILPKVFQKTNSPAIKTLAYGLALRLYRRVDAEKVINLIKNDPELQKNPIHFNTVAMIHYIKLNHLDV